MYKSTLKYNAIFGASFSILFLILRVLISPFFSYYLLSFRELSLFMKIFISMGIHLSLEWAWMIFNLLIKGFHET